MAHPERYPFYHGNYEAYTHLKDMGFLLQVNLLSLTGYYGKPVTKAAKFIFDNDLADLVAGPADEASGRRFRRRVVRHGQVRSDAQVEYLLGELAEVEQIVDAVADVVAREDHARGNLTAALSDNPFITFKLRVVREAPARF